MGIKNLWTILTPFCERKPLYELQGKTVAVDLSCWVCEAQNISEYSVQPKMYLRNLYFRTSFLILMGVYPVFVLEGKAPELKYDTIAARNAIQFKGAKPKTDKVKTGKDRTRFHFTLRQCEEFLGLMGLTCVKGKGEAESMCAYLNQNGLVDGCISQDSDCFAYGAKVVYRNFSISSQGAHASSGGAVDIYDIQKAKDNLDFGRNKIIALALLCGCDYSEGVLGVGKDSALKLFEKIKDKDILNRFQDWKKNISLFKEFEDQINDKNICTSCGHSGKLQAHTKNGCLECSTQKGCDFTKFKDERLLIKNELNIRSKCLADPNFPDKSLINEFLVEKDNVSKINIKWKQPDLIKFVHFTAKHLQWEEIYSFEKFLPILTRWQLLNFEYVHNTLETKKLTGRGFLYPNFIKKTRTPKGVPSYEIIWIDQDNFFKGLIPSNQLQEIDSLEKLWTTIEPQDLVEKAYPKIVEIFKESKIKPKKITKKRTVTKKTKEIDDLSNILQNTSISEQPAVKKSRKPRQNRLKTEKTTKIISNDLETLNDLENSFQGLEIAKKQTKLDTFVKKALINSQKQNTITSTPAKLKLDVSQCDVFSPIKKTAKTSKNTTFDLDMSNFGDESNSVDLSDIIDDIISKKTAPCQEIVQEINNFGLNLVKKDKKVENCSFFLNKSNTEVDLFEKTFDNKYILSDSEESDLENKDFDLGNKCNLENTASDLENNVDLGNFTDDFGFKSKKFGLKNDLDLQNEEFDLENSLSPKKCDISSNSCISDDSFSLNYVPLAQRIKNKPL